MRLQKGRGLPQKKSKEGARKDEEISVLRSQLAEKQNSLRKLTQRIVAVSFSLIFPPSLSII